MQKMADFLALCDGIVKNPQIAVVLDCVTVR
jgi:hypothetical protein